MNLWLKIGIVALGGAFGALCRTGLAELMAHRFDRGFAWGTLTANLVGCLLIGAARAAVEVADWGSLEMRTFVFSGFLGAFTTFSTFEADTVTLWQSGDRLLAATYLGTSVVGGLAFFGLGWFLTARLTAA